MNDRSKDDPRDAPLNPALRSETETVYETKVSSPDPIESTSTKGTEGTGWPVIWLVVTAVCVVFAIYFLT